MRNIMVHPYVRWVRSLSLRRKISVIHECVHINKHTWQMFEFVSFQHIITQAASKRPSESWQWECTRHWARWSTTRGICLIIATRMWLKCRCGNNRYIWPISTKSGVNRQISIKPPISNLTRIRPMQAAVIYVDRWTDSHDEGSRLFLCLYGRA
jgi:hypothetical protein